MTDPALYTFVVDYNGGTYTSQISAEDERAALYAWCGMCKAHDEVPDEVVPVAASIRASLDADTHEPVALHGLKAVWCASTLLEDKLALVNIVRTQA